MSAAVKIKSCLQLKFFQAVRRKIVFNFITSSMAKPTKNLCEGPRISWICYFFTDRRRNLRILVCNQSESAVKYYLLERYQNKRQKLIFLSFYILCVLPNALTRSVTRCDCDSSFWSRAHILLLRTENAILHCCFGRQARYLWYMVSKKLKFYIRTGEKVNSGCSMYKLYKNCHKSPHHNSRVI